MEVQDTKNVINVDDFKTKRVSPLRKHAFLVLGEIPQWGEFLAKFRRYFLLVSPKYKIINNRIIYVELPKPFRFRPAAVTIDDVTLQRIKVSDMLNYVDYF
jgi:hypothetical protein